MTVSQIYRSVQSREPRLFYKLTLAIIGMGVVFASVGLGEAVYRLLFLDFDGATDRLPIEILFGLAFAFVATKLARRIHRRRRETSARISLVWDRNHRIRHAVEAITPIPYAGNQQAIRVIREEVDRIEGALSDLVAR